MRHSAFTIIMILFSAYAMGQTVRVLDGVSLQPIENVAVSSGGHSVVTDAGGEADIGDFDKDRAVTFRHPSYRELRLNYQELVDAGFEVRLKAITFSSEVVISSASRWEQDRREVPSRIAKLTAEEMKFAEPQTAADMLGSTNEVFIQKSQLGGGSPMIRGFAANRVLLVVDGVRMNNAIFRGGNLQNVISLDVGAIESAEVIFGPGSVIYGSDAIGGVMDFHTLAPKLSYNDELIVTSNALTRFSSANTEKTAHADFGIAGRSWGLLTSLTFSDYGDLRMGSRGNDEYRRLEYVERIGGVDTVVINSDPDMQKFSGYNEANLLQKIRFKPGDNLEFDFGFHYSETSDVPRYDRLIERRNGRLRSAEWYYGPQKWLMSDLIIRYSSANSWFTEAKLVAAYQFYRESRNDRKFDDDQLRSRVETVDIFSLNLDFDKRLSERDSLFYGAEAVTNFVGSKASVKNIASGSVEPTSTRYPNGARWTSLAAYLSYKSNLSKRFTFIAGGRYSRVLLDAELDRTFFPFPFDEIAINTGAVNGSIGLVFRPDDSLQLNINATTGFRAPNVDDAGKVFDSEPGSVVVPNENLRSEYVWNLDLGVIKSFGNRLQVEATGFYTLLKDAMVRRDFSFNGQDFIFYDGELSRVQAIRNAEDATVYGGQFSLAADLSPNLSLRSSLTYTRGETNEGEALQHVPPLFGATHLSFVAARFRADFFAVYNGSIPFENLAPSERGKPHIYATDADGNPYSPAWFTLNLRSTYYFSRHLQLDLGLENIMDERYRPYASGIVAPGRNLKIALRSSF